MAGIKARATHRLAQTSKRGSILPTKSTGKVTQAAKLLIRQAYRAEPKHSYFMGCSNGGREAMLAAMRYPTEFDGVVAGNPGFRLSRGAIAQSWDNQHFQAAAPKNAQGECIFANRLDAKRLGCCRTRRVKPLRQK